MNMTMTTITTNTNKTNYDEFHLGYQLTRFLFARDETYASYICSLLGETIPTTNNHYFWISELLESGFHGDIICNMLVGLMYKHIIVNQPIDDINGYIYRMIDIIEDIVNIVDNYNKSKAIDKPLFNLKDIHNDNPHDDTENESYNIYDIYKQRIYTLSKVINAYGRKYIAEINEQEKFDDANDDEIKDVLSKLKELKIRDEQDIEMSILFSGLSIAPVNAKKAVQYINLYDKMKDLIIIKQESNKLKTTIYRGRSRSWKKDYPTELYPLLRKIEQYSTNLILTHEQKKQVYTMITTLYKKHIDTEQDLSMKERKENIIEKVYSIIEHIQEFTLNIIDREGPNMKTIMELLIMNENCLGFKDYIINTNPEYNKNDNMSYCNRSHIIDRNTFDNFMISLIYLQAFGCIRERKTPLSTSTEIDKIDCEDEEYLNIESLRTTPYQFVIRDRLETHDIPMKHLLPYRALLSVHEYSSMFPLVKKEMKISPRKALYIREFECENYCIYTPLWKYRYENYCNCGNGGFKYDYDTCEFNFDDMECCGECYDKINMDFMEQPRETKESIIGPY